MEPESTTAQPAVNCVGSGFVVHSQRNNVRQDPVSLVHEKLNCQETGMTGLQDSA